MAAAKPKKAVRKVRNPPQGPNPWDVAPILPQGDPAPEPIWLAVGRALTAWEKLDQIQSQIFGVIVSSRRGGAVAAYGVVSASTARSEMVAAAAEEVLIEEPELRGEVLGMVARVGKLGGRRNDITHGVVSHFTAEHRDEHGVLTKSDFGHFHVPASYATKKRNRERGDEDPMTMRGKYAYTADQIEEYGNAFHREYQDGVKLMFRLIAYFSVRWPPGARRPLEAPATPVLPAPTD